MVGSLHGSARTTPRVRAKLQASQDTTGTLAQRYGLSRTAVAKWRARAERPAQHRAHAGGGGHGGRVPAPHAPAA